MVICLFGWLCFVVVVFFVCFSFFILIFFFLGGVGVGGGECHRGPFMFSGWGVPPVALRRFDDFQALLVEEDPRCHSVHCSTEYNYRLSVS